MSKTNSFWDHPIDKLEEALSIRKQIAALQAKLGSLFGGDSDEPKAAATASRKTTGGTGRGGKRTMSAEARTRIAAAQRARWAKQKGQTSAPAATSASAAQSKAATKKGGKRKISPEARAKMAEAARQRWAKQKRGQ